MAIVERSVGNRLTPITDGVARALSRYGIKPGEPSAPAILRIELERGVTRVVQVYWTPFQVQIDGEAIGLHLEVAEPRVHWAECYLAPSQQSWVLCFYERPDGDIQLAFYESYATPDEAIEGFFTLSSWYVLTATDKTWNDVVYWVAPEVDWTPAHEAAAGASTNAAVQESLKKSTIMWLRWKDGAIERTMPVWYLLDNKSQKIYVLSGERQQTLPGAENIREADVILRQKGKNIQIAEMRAAVRVLEPGPEWDEAAEKIAEKRLNIPGLPEETARRWRDECVILELTVLT